MLTTKTTYKTVEMRNKSVSLVLRLSAVSKFSFVCNYSSLIFPQQEPAPLKPVRCEINPATIRASSTTASRAPMPQFQIYSEIDTTVCALDKPLTGKVGKEHFLINFYF